MKIEAPSPMFDTSELVLNMGPQHPSTHGVLRIVLRLDGERVVDADIVVGYLHRGIEKLCENRDWSQIILLTDRMDYVAAASSNLGYCETVEKLMSVEVPRRARYIRTILGELQRIASHCLWLGTHAMDIGAMTVFLYAFRERELILDLFEEYCGARLTYNATRIGGLPLDIPPGWDKKVREFCDIMDSKLGEYETLLTHNRIWLGRTLMGPKRSQWVFVDPRCAGLVFPETSARMSRTRPTMNLTSMCRLAPRGTPTIATSSGPKSFGSRSASFDRPWMGYPRGR